MTDDSCTAPPQPAAPTPGGDRQTRVEHHPDGPPDNPPGHPAVLAALSHAMANAGGRISFAEYMAICLYHPEGGYYLQAARRPGRAGDFLTAPETHPLFGQALAAFVAECRDRLGRPTPFTVREFGAGTGALAWDILGGLVAADPAALAGLRYELVEASPFRRAEALAALADAGYPEVVAAPDPAGPLAPIDGVVLANEVADAFPVHRLVWRNGALRERWVVPAPGGTGFAEEDGPLSPSMATFDPAAYLARHRITPNEGDRFDLAPAAAAWFAGAVRAIRRGYALVIDYGYEAPALFSGHRLGGTVRAYRHHAVGADPFVAPGDADLTAHVDFSLLREAAEAEGLVVAGFATQGELLAGLGLGELLVRLGQDPAATAADYYAAQAAVLRLVDPGGMGRFRALAVARDAPVAPSLRAFSVRIDEAVGGRR